MILVILRHQKMRTITNFFLANLAVADFFVGVFCVLPNLMINLRPNWVLGNVSTALLLFSSIHSTEMQGKVLCNFTGRCYSCRSRHDFDLCSS